MCGIAGLWVTEGRVDLGRLRRMSELTRHRGPDDEGIALFDPERGAHLTLGGPDTPRAVLDSDVPYGPGRGQGNAAEAAFRVGLVSRRLAILDLSPNGHMPMADVAGRTWITYNGEIYNYVELRRELEGLGAKFRSTGDVEMVLAAYRQWGHACLERFNGMFAFALWDTEKRELFCARDRLGVKPFYYQWDGRAFAFASEPRALALTQTTPIRPRLEAIRDLLELDWVDHAGYSFFDGIRQLPGGHLLVVSGDRVRCAPWWRLHPTRRAYGTPEEWAEEYRTLFDDAVRIRLRSDVEVGSCLSGGIDSSAVVLSAAKAAGKPLHTFTSAYDEGPAWDERPYARAVAEAAGAIPHVVVPTGDDFWPAFDRIAEIQDEPTAGPGLYSQWKVMELARNQKLKVLLDGQGADETMAGYFRYLPVRLRDLLAAGKLGAFAKLFGPVAERVGFSTALAHTLEPWLPAPLVGGLRRRFGQGKDRVLGPALKRRELERWERPRPDPRWPSRLASALAFDTTRRLLPSLLRYEDRNSMAHSIETRLPFLDYRLVEFAFALPDEQKLDGVVGKALERRAFAGRLPQRVLDRRDKMGFETPTDVWLRGRFAGEVRRRLLFAGPIHEWVDVGAMRSEVEDYLDGRRAIGLQIWRWLSLDAWARRYLVGGARVAASVPRVTPPSALAYPREAGRGVRPRGIDDARAATGSPAVTPVPAGVA
jgi:asparagine synthase (glutamine-hydrolysing)